MNFKVINDLVAFAIAEASRQDDPIALGPIHLVKYLYLADWAHAKENDGATLTGIPWRFVHFGPYCEGIEKDVELAANRATLGPSKFISKKFEKEFKRWGSDHDDPAAEEAYFALERTIPSAAVRIIKRMVKEFGNDTNPLLHEIYATMPMRLSAPGDLLDFSKAVNEMAVPGQGSGEPVPFTLAPHPKDLSKTQQKMRDKELDTYRQRMKNASIRSSEDELIYPEPVFDEVFFEGVAWLDSQDSLPSPMTAVFRIQPDLWHSQIRRSLS